jgi:transcriptional regulator with XRE-family HTH domain
VTKSRHQNQVLAFGKRLRELRLQKGLTMTELANQCDIEYRQIADIELGKINTTIAKVFLLSNALNISPKDLFDC